ncbi:hypothetical protein ATANTOWER_020413 [Ataeniobius toweri]|uniref:Uncharacterized protein n=1 Tax=Ataeniobius toweri TaxID=208326 RepID=A0ABU7CJV9_9TELE|nr:hypothetical protein [Ataeniobius toweri]
MGADLLCFYNPDIVLESSAYRQFLSLRSWCHGCKQTKRTEKELLMRFPKKNQEEWHEYACSSTMTHLLSVAESITSLTASVEHCSSFRSFVLDLCRQLTCLFDFSAVLNVPSRWQHV